MGESIFHRLQHAWNQGLVVLYPPGETPQILQETPRVLERAAEQIKKTNPKNAGIGNQLKQLVSGLPKEEARHAAITLLASIDNEI
jgi:hypothetical protein